MMTPRLDEHGDRRVGLEIVEPVEADEREVAEQDAGRQLAEHGRLSEPSRQVSADLRGDEDERQREDQRRDRVDVHPERFSRSLPMGQDRRNGGSGKHARRLQGRIVSATGWSGRIAGFWMFSGLFF